MVGKRNTPWAAATFPMTRSSLQLVRSASPQLSAGVLFRWNQPDWWIDGSLSGPVVRERAHQEAVQEFRHRFEIVQSHWRDLPQKPELLAGASIAFRGISETRLRRRWDEDFQYDFELRDDREPVRIFQEGDTQVVDAERALQPTEEMIRRQQRILMREDRKGGIVLAEEELLVGHGGWVLHGKQLARSFGLTPSDVQELQSHCGSLVGHLVHSNSCSLDAERVSEHIVARANRMSAAVKTMKVADADETLVAILGFQHEVRDSWAGGQLTIESAARVFPRRWLYLPSDALLSVLEPAKVFRGGARHVAQSYLLPLGVLSRANFSKAETQFGSPMLQDLVDCSDLVEFAQRAQLEAWLSDLPAKAKAGFCVELGRSVTRLLMPSFKKENGSRVWGMQAIKEATKHVELVRGNSEAVAEARETVARLKRQWERTGPGYFDYFWAISILARLHNWRPSARALARCLLSNLVSMRPKWGEDLSYEIVSGRRYWAKSFNLGHDHEDSIFYPALGPARFGWSLDAWMIAAGYVATKAASLPSPRVQFVDDMERLSRDMAVKWRVLGTAGRVVDLDEVRASVRSTTRWNGLRLEPLIPESCIENFYDHGYLLEVFLGEDEPDEDDFYPLWTPAQVGKRMRKKGMTQRQLAGAVGCTPSMISQILSGTKLISTEMAFKFEQVLKPRKRQRVNRDVPKNASS